MKRLALALAVIGLVACKKAENGTPATDSTAAPAAAPAPAMDSSSMMMNDSAKAMPADTSNMGMKKGN